MYKRQDEEGHLRRIVEAADASPEELAIGRVNAGLYALPTPEIFSYLRALKPDYAKVHSNLGAALVRQGQLQEALEHLTIALRLKPDDAQTHQNLRICLKLIKQNKN